MNLHFYELHEGPTDLLTDALLVSERAYSGAEFAALVQVARKAVLDTFEEDTLIEAVASWNGRTGSPTSVTRSFAASMSVGVRDEDTFLVEPRANSAALSSSSTDPDWNHRLREQDLDRPRLGR